jgi:hypothetical protein
MTKHLQAAYDLGVKLAFEGLAPDKFITGAIEAAEEDMLADPQDRSEAPVYDTGEKKNPTELASTKDQRNKKHPDEPDAAWFRDRSEINPNGGYA